MDELTNFRKTLNQLKRFIELPIQNDRDRAGIIQAFEYTFEQSWKAIQKKAGHEGVEVGSPKKAFMFALQNSWIDKNQEPIWIQMIEDRNLTTHTYKEDVAVEVLRNIMRDYAPEFTALLNAMMS